MPELISIGSYTKPDLIFQRLNNEFTVLQDEGFPFVFTVDKMGEITFLDCLPRPKKGYSLEKTFKIIREVIAQCLAELIVEEWEIALIKKIVRVDYYYYTFEEKQTILTKSRKMLNPNSLNPYFQKQRQEEIKLKIKNYLENHQKLIVEGFIIFRLRGYLQDLYNVVNLAVDEFLMEKEYNEFIRLLKYFVEIQEPRVEKVQVVFRKTGKFSLLDEFGHPIKHECLDGLVLDLFENEINYEDLLISALITLAPRELLIHREKDTEIGEILGTIKTVFAERVAICPGCPKCTLEEKK